MWGFTFSEQNYCKTAKHMRWLSLNMEGGCTIGFNKLLHASRDGQSG